MRYQLTNNQIASKVADETVILNHDKGSYYGLDEVGAVVWDQLEKGAQSIDTLCEAVVAEYEVELNGCKDDISHLLEELIAEGLVEETE